MEIRMETNDLKMICVIVNFGQGSKVLKISKANGISGGSILLGRGTIKNSILEFLELAESRKEVVLIVGKEPCVTNILQALNRELHLHKPNHGIAFTVSVSKILGSHNKGANNASMNGGSSQMKYDAIYVVVERGNAENVIDAATSAGSRGGTIINARGSGIHETNTLFSMPIEPEKEIVLILSEKNTTSAIVESINKSIKVEEPGNGILFVLDVKDTYGLY